jgi:multisubunit Na+/H+ antiporter MnhE subunit
VYLGGFIVIKQILTHADVDIVRIKTKVSNKFLQTVLSNSITLIPGSTSLDMTDNTITVLRFKDKIDDSPDSEKAGEALKGNLEKILLKAER